MAQGAATVPVVRIGYAGLHLAPALSNSCIMKGQQQGTPQAMSRQQRGEWMWLLRNTQGQAAFDSALAAVAGPFALCRSTAHHWPLEYEQHALPMQLRQQEPKASPKAPRWTLPCRCRLHQNKPSVLGHHACPSHCRPLTRSGLL